MPRTCCWSRGEGGRDEGREETSGVFDWEKRQKRGSSDMTERRRKEKEKRQMNMNEKK